MPGPTSRAYHAWLNCCQAGLLVTALAGLVGLTGWLAGGWLGVIIAAGGVLGLILATPAPERDLFDQLGAMPLDPHQAPELHRIVTSLSKRAELEQTPRLYLLPVSSLQAMAAGDRQQPALAVTAGLLHLLPPRELTAVLAHEIAHLRHGDLQVMRFADTVSALTRHLSDLGIVLLLLWLPMLLMMHEPPSPFAFLLLLAAPSLGDLVSLSLSRRRELVADDGAVVLTQDPGGLAAALSHLQDVQGQGWQSEGQGRRRGFLPRLHWFRTHPRITERMKRLAEMARPVREESWPEGVLSGPEQLRLARNQSAAGREEAMERHQWPAAPDPDTRIKARAAFLPTIRRRDGQTRKR